MYIIFSSTYEQNIIKNLHTQNKCLKVNFGFVTLSVWGFRNLHKKIDFCQNNFLNQNISEVAGLIFIEVSNSTKSHLSQKVSDRQKNRYLELQSSFAADKFK